MANPELRTIQKAYLPLKRLIAIIGSLVGILFCFLLLWWWVLPVNAIVTRGHPFFASSRIGKNGKSFKLIKFRSMRLDADPNMSSMNTDAQKQVTKFGKFLRCSSLDETPQLFNIFMGSMAFIGPRPLIQTNEDAITIGERKRNGAATLRPGLSGYAQIHNRASLDPAVKAKYDGEYFERMSLWFDTKIFVLTFFQLFGAAKGR